MYVRACTMTPTTTFTCNCQARRSFCCTLLSSGNTCISSRPSTRAIAKDNTTSERDTWMQERTTIEEEGCIVQFLEVCLARW
jgi:hypothetical protein